MTSKIKRQKVKAYVPLPLLLAFTFLTSCSDKKVVEEKQQDQQTHNEHNHSGEHSHGDGHSHSHGHDFGGTPHAGIVKAVKSGETQIGFAELKLHDDKGDLELWITKDEAGTQPFDLTLDSTITVTFPKMNNKTVTLRVRNSDKNEDEDGKGNIRDGKTNYFIFPGDTGADASFLMGKDFASDVILTFKVEGSEHTTGSFELIPHTH